MKAILVILALLLSSSALADWWFFSSNKIKDDEQVIFFPSEAYQQPGSNEWTIDFHGWIFEPKTLGEISSMARKVLHIPPDDDDEQDSLLKQRLHWFTVDNERGKRLSVELGKQAVKLNPSAANGHFNGATTLSDASLQTLPVSNSDRLIHFKALTSKGDKRRFAGEIHPVMPTGLSIISDLDDTIKISNVTNKQELIKNTFMRPFQAVPGMAKLYQQWQQNHAAIFHYVSASPWQLYPELSAFMQASQFPRGLFYMKSFRLKDSSFLNLFSDPVEYKKEIIESIFTRYPNREFILVGDSGEKDPEVYGMLARQYPERVKRILIRQVGDHNSLERFTSAFEGIPQGIWQTFDDTMEIGLTATALDTVPASAQ